jgi:pimeloyl-ACP methyl ester carboxylesterase
VYENRATRRGRRIALNVVVIPATGSPREPDAFTVFTGGPGEAAATEALGSAEQFRLELEHHDLLLVDQRGTGGSHPLQCDLFGSLDSLQGWLGSFLPVAAVTRCRARLEHDADLTQYLTAYAADDFDDVRAALGYERVNVWGGSYGTRMALVYLKRHPEHVRSLVLQGVDPTSDFAPATFARDAQRALDGLFDECEADRACHAAFPNVRTEMRDVVAQVERGPVQVEVIHPRSGEVVTVVLNRDLFGEAIRYMLYSAGAASWIPAVVHAAAMGNFTPIAERAIFGRQRIVGAGSPGLYLSVTCAEDVPWIDVAASERGSRSTFLGDYRLRDQRAECAVWPRGTPEPGFDQPTRSAVPALLLSGQWDPVTPPALGERAARSLSNSAHLVIPSGGHGYDGLAHIECLDSLIARFVDQASVAGLDMSCIARMHRKSFPTTLPPTRPVVLEGSALRAFAGSYVDHIPVTIEALERTLHLRVAGGRELTLVPVGPATFRAAGAPVAATFHQDSTGVMRATIEVDGVPVDTLVRARQ